MYIVEVLDMDMGGYIAVAVYTERSRADEEAKKIQDKDASNQYRPWVRPIALDPKAEEMEIFQYLFKKM